MAYHAPPHAAFNTSRGSIHSTGSRKGSVGKDTEDEELLVFPKEQTNFSTDYGPPPLEELKQQDASCGFYDTYPKYDPADSSLEWGAVKLCVLLMGMVFLLITFGYYWLFVKATSKDSKAPPVFGPIM